MIKHLLLPAFWAVAAAHETLPRTIGQPCTRGQKGILFHVSDPTDFSRGCQVTAILKKDCLLLFRGNKQTARIDLDAIETPIHIVPYHENCLSIQPGGRNAEILCCDSDACKDAWWMALSEQILCRHRGSMRNEVAGEPTVEEEERQVLERIVETPKEPGTTIKIQKGPAEDVSSDAGNNVSSEVTTRRLPRSPETDLCRPSAQEASSLFPDSSGGQQINTSNSSSGTVSNSTVGGIKLPDCVPENGTYVEHAACERSSCAGTGNRRTLSRFNSIAMSTSQAENSDEARERKARNRTLAASSRIRIRKIASDVSGDICELTIQVNVDACGGGKPREVKKCSEDAKTECSKTDCTPAPSSPVSDLPSYSSLSPSFGSSPSLAMSLRAPSTSVSFLAPSSSASSSPSSPSSSSLSTPSSSTSSSSTSSSSTSSPSSSSPSSSSSSSSSSSLSSFSSSSAPRCSEGRSLPTNDEIEICSSATFFRLCLPARIQRVSVQSSSAFCRKTKSGGTLGVFSLKLLFHLAGDACLSGPDLLSDKEAEYLRRASPFLIKCKNCSKTFAALKEPDILRLPSDLWSDMAEAMVCEECPPLKIARDKFLPRSNQVCVGNNFIAVNPWNVEGAALRRRSNVVECAACTAIVGICSPANASTLWMGETEDHRCCFHSNEQSSSPKENAAASTITVATQPQDVRGSSEEEAARDGCSTCRPATACRNSQISLDSCACGLSLIAEEMCPHCFGEAATNGIGCSNRSLESSRGRDLTCSRDMQENRTTRESYVPVGDSCSNAFVRTHTESAWHAHNACTCEPVCTAACCGSSTHTRDISSSAGSDSNRADGSEESSSTGAYNSNGSRNTGCTSRHEDTNDRNSANSICGDRRSGRFGTSGEEIPRLEEVRFFKQRVRVPLCEELRNTACAGDIFWRYTDVSCLTAKLQRVCQTKHVSKFLFSIDETASCSVSRALLSDIAVPRTSAAFNTGAEPSELSGFLSGSRSCSAVPAGLRGDAAVEKCSGNTDPAFYSKAAFAAGNCCKAGLLAHCGTLSAVAAPSDTSSERCGLRDTGPACASRGAPVSHDVGAAAAVEDIKRVAAAFDITKEEVEASLSCIKYVGVTVLIPDMCGVQLQASGCSMLVAEGAKENAAALQEHQATTSVRAMKVLCKAFSAAGDAEETRAETCYPDEKFTGKAHRLQLSPHLFTQFVMHLWQHTKCCYEPSFTLSSRCLSDWTPSLLPLPPPADTL